MFKSQINILPGHKKKMELETKRFDEKLYSGHPPTPPRKIDQNAIDCPHHTSSRQIWTIGDNTLKPTKKKRKKNSPSSVNTPRASHMASLTAGTLNEFALANPAAVAGVAGVAVGVGVCRLRSETRFPICVPHNTRTDLGHDGDKIRVWRTS